MEISQDCIWIASFDIGKKHFSFCLEEVNLLKFSNVNTVKPKDRYNKDGTPTLEFANSFQHVSDNGKILLLELKDLTEGVSTTKHLDPKILINLTHYLDSFKDYWIKCSMFIIEQQMGFGKRQNTMALKIGQHCMSYFLFQFAGFKMITEFPSYYKTKVIGAPKKLTKHKRKTWSVEEAIRILTNRQRIAELSQSATSTLAILMGKKKKDDVADVITQLQAFKWLYFIDKHEF